ncbi:MurR/RpiR family transcriptional regulator [Marinilactibacillus sp. GCM10026970]|uniref:MurR/RpiR family transcriptional regulator n=1 Tax=Marinilactibacillus sp. GCM10026970 TaxID=3252642 RepID=UPI003612D421
MRLEERINTYYSQLSKTDFIISNYIISNKSNIIKMSVEEISSAVFVSAASVVRFAKKLGFSGFSELKYFLKEELDEHEKHDETSTFLLTKDIEETTNLVTQTNLQPICQSIKQASRVFSYGTDWGERVSSEYLVRNFMMADLFIQPVPSLTEMNWLIDKMTPNDLVIIFSYSGERAPVRSVMSQLKVRGIPVISITPLSNNFLSTEATYRLYYKSTQLKQDPNNLKEYNFFTTLNLLAEYLFRYYYDNFM